MKTYRIEPLNEGQALNYVEYKKCSGSEIEEYAIQMRRLLQKALPIATISVAVFLNDEFDTPLFIVE